MIFVTLGTQDKAFPRLLQAVEQQIRSGHITDRVVVQAGYTSYESDCMEIFSYLEKEDFERFMEGCDILITHGGVGSIMTGLHAGKRIIAAARLAQYGEHTNDHQLQIIQKFSQCRYLVALEDFSRLAEAIEQAKSLPLEKYPSNTRTIVSFLEDYIDRL